MPTRRRWRDVLRDRLAERAVFAGIGGWMLHLYDRALNRRPGWPLPMRRRAVTVRVHDGSRVRVRLGTSDVGVLLELWDPNGRGDYQRVLDGSVGPVRTILDLGSNIGLSIRLFQRAFPGVKLVGVEPDAGNLRVCRENVRLGGRESDVVLIEACVGGGRGEVSLDRSGGEWGFRMSEASGPERIPVITVRDCIDRLGDGAAGVDLVKMDVEGAEQAIFAADTSWLNGVRYLVIEIHRPYTEERFLAELRRVWPGAHPESLKSQPGLSLLLVGNPANEPGEARTR